ncbi:CRISPR-associated endonuclease Cas1 [Vibrio sp. PNB22_4_1]|uniref:CRISPR-associated endonuclease Cas1 n=1 Tax=unclassified Vibrio TaxID=2614977 RepID=UPI00406A98EF
MEISAYQHHDSIWTWKSTKNGKVSLWLPYFDRVEPSKIRKKDHYRFIYKGGEISASLSKIEFIMFYGASGHIPVEFLDKLASYRIPLMIHRRNMPSPYLFFPDSGNDSSDVLSRQILARENGIKSVYIARTLIHARFRSMEYLITIAPSYYTKLKHCRTIDTVRVLEAEITARYWKAYFKRLGLEEDMIRRDKGHPVNRALDAASYFVSGILLRWVLFHKLSPEHGYLHVQTTYPSLVFDLMEPYRYLFEKALLEVMPKGGLAEGAMLTGAVINKLKITLDEPVYVPITRQTVRAKNLYHGVVLGLRAYLVKDMVRFVVPVAGEKSGGRPLKVSFKMPGGMKV